MAVIDFQILGNANASPSLETFSGSGLGFFGATAGSSVQIGAYQDSTYVSNSNGTVTKDQTNNIKYVGDTFPSGMCTVNAIGSPYGPIGLSGVKNHQATLGIRFGHTTDTKVQNCQLRIYNRTNINNPASGVNTKVAEIVNFNGSTWNNQGTLGVPSNVVGSGDAFWWGEAWPSQLTSSQNSYTNSLGTVFYNGRDSDSVVNGDAKLVYAGAPVDNDLTVGGSGIVVPLLDSPGSGGRGLYEDMQWPKWTQYIASAQQATWGGPNFGDGSAALNKPKTYGGTGYHSHHTWSVALSATPLSIGSKEQYGLYVSLEYL